jgi:hypothetical protein
MSQFGFETTGAEVVEAFPGQVKDKTSVFYHVRS